jgi:hypothetical protein
MAPEALPSPSASKEKLPSPKKSPSSKDKDKKDKKKKAPKKRKTSKRTSSKGSKDEPVEPAYAPYLAIFSEFYRYAVDTIRGPQYDPYGPHPEEQLAEYKKQLAKRGNCQLYITTLFLLLIPVFVLGSTAREKEAVCTADRDYCNEKCITDLQEQLSKSTSSTGGTNTLSGQNDLVIECREKCEANYWECNRPTYLIYAGVGMLLFSCPASMCLTNIFDTVREASRKEAEKLRKEGLEAEERKATAPKQRERYVSKRNQTKELEALKEAGEAAGTEDGEAPPASPTKKSSEFGSDDDDDLRSDLEELEDAKAPSQAGKCARILGMVFVQCGKSCLRTVTKPVYAVKRKYDKIMKKGGAPPPLEAFTEMECPRCNTAISVQGLDQINVQESLFSRQWGLQRCATYCPVCNEVISGIAAF